MATTCCLCGKQQHGMLPSFPLSAEHRNLDVCEECHQRLTHLEEHARQKPEVYQKERALLYEFLKTGQLSPVVTDFLNEQLYHCDTIAAPFLTEQKKKMLREKSAARIGNISVNSAGKSLNLTAARLKVISWVVLALSLILALFTGATITPMFFFGESNFDAGAFAALLILGFVLFLGCRISAAHLANQEQIISFLYNLSKDADKENVE